MPLALLGARSILILGVHGGLLDILSRLLGHRTAFRVKAFALALRWAITASTASATGTAAATTASCAVTSVIPTACTSTFWASFTTAIARLATCFVATGAITAATAFALVFFSGI